MRYLNCNQVLPPELIAQIQMYVDGAYLYIPRRAESRRAWGEVSHTRGRNTQRNREICRLYRAGTPVRTLSERFCLSEKTVYAILSRGKNG